MELPGWIFLTVSWTAIIGLMVFAYSRVFKKNTERKR